MRCCWGWRARAVAGDQNVSPCKLTANPAKLVLWREGAGCSGQRTPHGADEWRAAREPEGYIAKDRVRLPAPWRGVDGCGWVWIGGPAVACTTMQPLRRAGQRDLRYLSGHTTASANRGAGSSRPAVRREGEECASVFLAGSWAWLRSLVRAAAEAAAASAAGGRVSAGAVVGVCARVWNRMATTQKGRGADRAESTR